MNMTTEVIEMGKISARGQVAIPIEIRDQMGLRKGEKVLFVLADDTLILKKVTLDSFSKITGHLKKRAAKLGLKEENMSELVHKFRKRK